MFVLPSVVFLPRGLALIKAANKLEAVRMMRMTDTKDVISDQREVQFHSVGIITFLLRLTAIMEIQQA